MKRKTKVTDVPLPEITGMGGEEFEEGLRQGSPRFEDVAKLDVNAVFPGDEGPPLHLKTLELTNPDDLDDLELLLVDARRRLNDLAAVHEAFRPILDQVPMERLESALEHADENGLDAVRGAFGDGGSLLSIWKPSDSEELTEMQAQVNEARRLFEGRPAQRDEFIAAKVMYWLGELEHREYEDQIFQNTLLSYNFGEKAPWVPRPDPNEGMSRDDHLKMDPNEPKVLVQGNPQNPFDRWKPAVPPIVAAPKPISILEQAQAVVHGPRRDAYGHPTLNHRRIADLWSAYIEGKYEVKLNLTPIDAVLMMEQVKIARLMQTPDHRDSWTDMAGYAACGAIISGVDDA